MNQTSPKTLDNSGDAAPPWEVIIVGGGPAGLSAALLLGRCRRRVLLCDDGHPRNASSRALHGFLSRDGMDPAEFLRVSREQLAPYDTVESRHVRVEDAERGRNEFTVLLEGGEKARARFLLLAAGIVDEPPGIPGMERFYGVTVHTCPYCGAWEHRDQPLAVAGADAAAAELALELSQWSRKVTLCLNGGPEYGERLKGALERSGARVRTSPILRLEGEGNRLERVLFKDGESLECAALFISPKQRQRSPLAEKLGCEFCDEEGGGGIRCGESAVTSVPGVYAAGNAVRGMQLAIIAAAEGTRAAHAINTALLEADQAPEAE